MEVGPGFRFRPGFPFGAILLLNRRMRDCGELLPKEDAGVEEPGELARGTRDVMCAGL